MRPARIYPWRKMHRSRAPSIALGTFFVAQFSADCTTNMSGFDCRQAQPTNRDAARIRAAFNVCYVLNSGAKAAIAGDPSRPTAAIDNRPTTKPEDAAVGRIVAHATR